MADENTNPAPSTEPTTTETTPETPVSDTPTVDGILDLRPAPESAKAELLRLGLTYDRVDDTTNREIWMDYPRHLASSFDVTEGTPVTITDTATGQTATLTLPELRAVTRILVSGDTK